MITLIYFGKKGKRSIALGRHILHMHRHSVAFCRFKSYSYSASPSPRIPYSRVVKKNWRYECLHKACAYPLWWWLIHNANPHILIILVLGFIFTCCSSHLVWTSEKNDIKLYFSGPDLCGNMKFQWLTLCCTSCFCFAYLCSLVFAKHWWRKKNCVNTLSNIKLQLK